MIGRKELVDTDVKIAITYMLHIFKKVMKNNMIMKEKQDIKNIQMDYLEMKMQYLKLNTTELE